MRFRRLVRLRVSALTVSLVTMLLPCSGVVRAAQPVVVSNASVTKITLTSASLAQTIDALARSADFKVTYEGPRPTAMLFNAEIDTPSVAETLARLLDGQNLNYGIVFDLTGKKVTLLMILGSAAKTGAATATGTTPARPQPFAAPRSPRNDLPPVDDDPAEATVEPEPAPAPTPTPVASPTVPARGGPVSPFQPPSPFAPRPFGVPPGMPPRPSPTPLP